MFKSYLLLNLLLALFITLLGVRLHAVLTTNFEIPMQARAATVANMDKKAEEQSKEQSAYRTKSSYDLIASNNLFHPSRSSVEDSPQIATPVSESEIPQLFGTIIMGDRKLAILEDKAAKKSSLYEVNDSVSGFLVAQIGLDRVILQRGGESIDVNLRTDKKISQPKRPKARQRVVPGRKQRRRRPVRRSPGR